MNSNYSEILRLRSQEFYSSLMSFGDNNNATNHWLQTAANFTPISRSNSSLSLDQKSRTFHHNNQNTIHFNEFQELRECRFGSDRNKQTTHPSKSVTSLSSSAVSPKRTPSTTASTTATPKSVSQSRAKSRTISSIHSSLSISNENLSQKTKQKKTKSLFFSSTTTSKSASKEKPNDKTDANCEDIQEMERRRRLRQLFIHYDIQSALSLDELFNDDNNTTATPTTASNDNTTSGPSSLTSSNSSDSVTNDKNGVKCDDSDDTDETQLSENEFNSNSLLAFSSNFRNEIGKELVHCLHLNRENSGNDNNDNPVVNKTSPQRPQRRARRPIHTPALARQLSCLSSFDMSSDVTQASLLTMCANNTQTLCPFSKDYDLEEKCLETDFGANYYRKYFYGFSHQNWFQVLTTKDDKKTTKTAIALSLRKDSKDLKKFRLILRTNHSLKALKGFLNLNHLKSNENDMNLKSLLELLLPKKWTKDAEFVNSCRLGFDAKSDDLLLKFDELLENNFFKIGILYARDSQSTEEDFYNNRDVFDDDFDAFLSSIGTRVRLKGYKGFRGGLDVTTDTTGSHAFATTEKGREVIYHVMSELPFSHNNRQQLLRKRHIGNDIVTIVFQSKHFRGKPFDPSLIRSHFQHVFLVVRPHHNGYRVAVARHKDVPAFGPPLKPFYRREELRAFLLAKVLNAENACHRCAKFKQMALRTRFEYLNDLFQNFTTQTTVSSLQSSLSFPTSSSTQQLIQFSQNFNKYFSQMFPKKTEKQAKNKPNDTTTATTGGDALTSVKTSTESKNIFLENELFFGAKLYEAIDDVLDDTNGRRHDDERRHDVTTSRLKCHSFQHNVDVCDVKILLSQNFLLVLSKRKVLFVLQLEQIIGFLLTNGEKSRDSWNANAIEIQFKVYFHFGELLLLKELLFDSNPTDSESRDANIERNSLLFELKADLMTKIRSNSREGALRTRQMKAVVLRRNALSSDASFGFHIQSKALNCAQNVCVFVTEVNEHALRVNELRRGQRLLELCHLSLISLSYQEILDFLKTSQNVSIALVQPLADGSPRTNGCFSAFCSAQALQNSNQNLQQNDYENIQTVVKQDIVRPLVVADRQTPVLSSLTSLATTPTPPTTRSPQHVMNVYNTGRQHTSPTHTTSHSQRPLHVKSNQMSHHFQNANHMSSQSSTASSTLQEDLIKLITLNDGDDETTERTLDSNSHSSSRYSTATSTPYSSLERPSPESRRPSLPTTKMTPRRQPLTTADDDCVVTVAKPAFVVNSTSAVFARKQLIDDTLNSNITTDHVLAEEELQWPPLVATHDTHLKEQVKELSKEKQRLNETIRQLKEENQRLHFESQTASQQLRKFTEWFFSSSSGDTNDDNNS